MKLWQIGLVGGAGAFFGVMLDGVLDDVLWHRDLVEVCQEKTMMNATIRPAVLTDGVTALFALHDGTVLGKYHLSLPAPLREDLIWFVENRRVTAMMEIVDNGPVRFVLGGRDDFIVLKRAVNRFSAGATA